MINNIGLGSLIFMFYYTGRFIKNLPRCEWHMCKVLEINTSSDGKVKSAKLLLGHRNHSTGTVLNRSIKK